DSGDATSFYLDNGNIKFDTPKEGSITFDGVPVNTILGRVSDAESAANNASDKVDDAISAGERARSAASDAASQALAASEAGEDAKSAAVKAQAAGEDAKAQAKDTRDRIIYYSSISDEKDVAIPGKYIIVNTDTYIRDGTIKTAHIGDAAITNAKIADLAVGNAQIEDAAITRAKIGNLAVGTAQIEDAAITDAKVGTLSADHLMAGTIDFYKIDGININASNITTGTLGAERLAVANLSAISADLGNVTAGNLKGVNIVASSFSTPNGSFTTDENGNVTASNLRITGVTNLVYNAALLGNNGSYIPGWSISNNAICWSNVIHDGVPSIGWNNTTGAGVWNLFAQTKLYPLNGSTGIPFSASVWFKDFGSDTTMQFNLTLAFFDSNGNRIDGAYVSNTWNGISSSQGWRYVTIDNAVAPSNAVSVGLQYWAYNGTGNAAFSSPMLTQTAHSTGYQPDTGNVINAGIINGSVINGATINTPNLDLGLNGTFNETYNYTQDTSWFLPKKASGSVTFNHGVIEDQGTMQSYVNGTWGGMNDSSVFTSGLTNNVWTEYAPGYYKIDMYKQGSTTNVLQRAYADPTGYYYTDAAGDKTYLGNILQTPQVQTPSLFATVLNQMPGQLRMKMVANGSDWGLQVGSYAGSEAVLSDFIYNSTSSSSANLYITANGHIVRSTSASKYKYNIKHAIDEDSLADKLLTMHVSTWNDKHAVDSYAQTLTDNTESEDISIKDNYGLIAEDLRDAGLDMFIEYGKNHTIEGIEYDRAWLPLLPKIRQMNDKINEYELRISKLEAKINE
ncbi:phage tail protein, partial [Lactobacillus acetotolerans]|uniref:phage tail protein n=1 Tax=Lactobacillus acetotolerans TaxID=1600 RepID=UPI002FDA4CCD